jgi:Leucine Rich repeat
MVLWQGLLTSMLGFSEAEHHESTSTTTRSNATHQRDASLSKSGKEDTDDDNDDYLAIDPRLVKTVESVVKGESKCIKVLGAKINIQNMEFLISSLSSSKSCRDDDCNITSTATTASAVIVEQVWLTCSDLQEEDSQEVGEVTALDLLCQFLQQHETSIHTIVFSRNEFGNNNIARILPTVCFYRNNRTLLELNLSTNKIQGTNGGAAIRELLQHNDFLKKLVLWNNPLGPDGAREVAAGLVVNTTMEYLDLGLCSLGDDGLEVIVHALTVAKIVGVPRQGRSGIKFLDLHANKLTSKALNSLTKLLSSPASPRIETLNVWHTADLLQDPKLVRPFSCALARNTSVRRLNLRECGMNDMAALWLFPAIEVNTTLEYFNVFCEYEQLGPIGCQQLLKSLPNLQPRHVTCHAVFWPGSHAEAFLTGIEKNLRLHAVNGAHVMGNQEELKFFFERNKLHAHAVGLVTDQIETVPLGIWPLALGKMSQANTTTNGVALSAIFEMLQNGVAQWI